MYLFKICMVSISLILMTSQLSFARSIEEIKASGVINVSVKADYKPFGYKNDKGENVGLEIDLAKEVAEELGVKPVFIEVSSKTRMGTLVDGNADLMIATMTDKPDRRKIVYAIEVPYYSSGTNILFSSSSTVKTWADIRGKTLCGTNGAYYNDFVVDTFGAKISISDSNGDSLKALKEGACEGFVFDDSYILSILAEKEWSEGFAMPLDTIDDAPWALAVRPGQQDMYDFMKEKVIAWHKSKRILSLEDKYGIKNSKYALKMNALFSK
ncbi:MAG: transporter substrate-binding domain-containing protein [Cellvibrionaceae bacterium]